MLRHSNGQLLGLRSAGSGPDGNEERPLERRRRSCGEFGRGAAGGLEGGLGNASCNSAADYFANSSATTPQSKQNPPVGRVRTCLSLIAQILHVLGTVWATCKMRRCNTSNLHRVGAYTKHAASRGSNARCNSTHAIVRNTKPAHTTASAPSGWPCTQLKSEL